MALFFTRPLLVMSMIGAPAETLGVANGPNLPQEPPDTEYPHTFRLAAVAPNRPWRN
jgi:hypothetical protein